MSYIVAVLPDRIKAEEAFTALEKSKVPMAQMSILGRGYKTADEFGLSDPKEQGKKRAIAMAYWLVPFGFAAGYLFNLITGLDNLDWAGEPGNHIVGGILGAIGGAMGSFFVGGGVGLATGDDDALPYRNRLNEGKYLVVVKGSQALLNKAAGILTKYNPETLQGYQ